MSEKRGHFVRLYPEPGAREPKDRIGKPRKLGLKKERFRVIVRKRAKYVAHSNSLEVHAYLLAMKWAARC